MLFLTLDYDLNNRDIDFIIKPKDIFMHEKSWSFYEKVVSESGIDVTKLENYIIMPGSRWSFS